MAVPTTSGRSTEAPVFLEQRQVTENEVGISKATEKEAPNAAGDF